MQNHIIPVLLILVTFNTWTQIAEMANVFAHFVLHFKSFEYWAAVIAKLFLAVKNIFFLPCVLKKLKYWSRK